MRTVAVHSSIPSLASHVQRAVGSGVRVLNLEPSTPLDQTICSQADFLIAEHGLLGPILNLPDYGRLKFVQNTWAGVDSLVRRLSEGHQPRPTLKLARLNHPKFSQLMAEYSLAAVINLERRFKLALELQNKKSWSISPELKGYRCLSELTVGILGVGQIGQCTANLLRALGCKVLGLVSKERLATDQDVVAQYFTRLELPQLLSSVDYLINILPSTPDTDNILSKEVLRSCDQVGFVNIGRGNVIREEDIIYALDHGHFSGAVLDVFQQEPLPASSLLWSHKDVLVTPHVAGESRAQDIADCFKSNLAKLDSGEDIDCCVDWDKLY